MTGAERARRWRQLHASGLPAGRPVTAEHGTVSAYKRHRRHGEQPCDACRLAWNAFMRDYVRAKKS
jgi:hypothetical protein